MENYQSTERPQVGVGVIVARDRKVLLGKRRGAHGEGDWSFPGGHLEFGESFEECAARETFEESGVKIKNIRNGTFTNDLFPAGRKHYVTVFILADYESGEAAVKEPEKCERWGWFEWDKLPEPLFVPLQNLLKQKFNPFKL